MRHGVNQGNIKSLFSEPECVNASTATNINDSGRRIGKESTHEFSCAQQFKLAADSGESTRFINLVVMQVSFRKKDRFLTVRIVHKIQTPSH